MFFLFIVSIILILIILLLEADRQFIQTHNFKNYYIINFPHQILFGIHNSLLRYKLNKSVYPISVVEFDNLLWNNQLTLKKQFKKYLMLNKQKDFAHNIFTFFPKDNSYWYVVLKMNNVLNNINVNYFPVIKQLLQSYPKIYSCFISVMEQNKHIPFHRGPYNGFLTYHFPIITNSEKLNDSYLEIMGQRLYSNQSFLFDDTYPHRLIKNNSNLRVVLICEIENPYLCWFKPHKFLPTSLSIP